MAMNVCRESYMLFQVKRGYDIIKGNADLATPKCPVSNPAMS